RGLSARGWVRSMARQPIFVLDPLCFFFSSRRRHTRFSRDWSSDVCSSDLTALPPEILEYESPPGTYHDAYPLMIMTTSALRSLREALPGSVVDVRRFRPSVLVDTGDAPGHPEMGWVGRRLRIGSVEVEVRTPCPRCVMVTREIDAEVPEDR